MSRQRDRSLAAALEYIKKNKMTTDRARDARKAVRAAVRPMTEARKQVRAYKKDYYALSVGARGKVDLSDVQEVRCVLLRRDGVLFSPHTDLIHKLEVSVLEGITAGEFRKRADTILSMPLSMRPKDRTREAEFARASLGW